MRSFIRNLLDKLMWPRVKIPREVLLETSKRYRLSAKKFTVIRSSGITVVIEAAEGTILRISHQSHQSYEELQSEIDWQMFLHAGGAPVVNVLHSVYGNYLEKITAGNSYYTAISFEKAPGKIITDAEFDGTFFYKTGELTGLLHQLTKSYVPSAGIKPRRTWHETESQMIHECIPAQDKILIEKFDSGISKLHTNSISKDTYGLIHNDIQRGNMRLLNGNITLFDFGDCCYSWFVNDIACIVYNAFKHYKGNLKYWNEYLKEFFIPFMEGYRRKNTLPENQLTLIPMLVHLRAISLYAFLHKVWNVSALSQAQLNYFNQAKEFARSDYLATLSLT